MGECQREWMGLEQNAPLGFSLQATGMTQQGGRLLPRAAHRAPSYHLQNPALQRERQPAGAGISQAWAGVHAGWFHHTPPRRGHVRDVWSRDDTNRHRPRVAGDQAAGHRGLCLQQRR